MSIWLLLVAGLATGAHAATWGAHKDSPFEGFRYASFLRSMVLGIVAAALLWPLLRDVPWPIAIGVLYTAERLATEWWKTIVREDDQSAYSIPMRLGVGGRPVDDRAIRWTVGVLVALGFATLCAVVAQIPADGWPWWALAVVGGTSGWFIAGGGAWKDAPVEGFSGWKFLRSPVVATACAVPLALFTDDLAWLMLASGGASVAVIETYKTYLAGRAPGKFADKPAPYADRSRGLQRGLTGAHTTLWLVFVVVMVRAGLALR